MSAEVVAQEVVDRLRRLADPARAAGEARYLTSTREHIGVRVPEVRRTVRAVAREHDVASRPDVLALAAALWSDGGVHERCLAAVELLVHHAAVLTAADLELVEELLRRSGTWALVDPMAESVAGDVIARDPAAADVLERWVRDPDFWLRRSALLALLGPLRAGDGDFARFSRYADGLLGEREFFVRKAIGWVLRETGKRSPDLVSAWLADREPAVPALVRREATKYLP